ncbi:MAG: Fructose-2,6-bisphosphatase [Oscillospiraceae bacterium]|nr:Fructose-2,6-bisphosphatase [Oscillospiraceae bacterium]
MDAKYIGSTDIDLCEQGIKELQELSVDFEYPFAQIVYSSPLKRCLQTAEVLYPDVLTIPINGMREYDFGDFEDKPMNELKNDERFKVWIESGMTKAPQGGELKQDFDARIEQAFEEVLKDMMSKGITSAALITHGGVIMNLLTLLGLPKRSPLDWTVGNGKGYTVVTSSYLWGSGRVFEVMDTLPYGSADISQTKGYNLIEVFDSESGE